MSKLYNAYISLKANEKNNENTLYLFKSGIFFICIDKDAEIASRLLNLKLSNLNEDIVKCGFPIQSLNKYSNLLRLSNYSFKIIDLSKNESISINDFNFNNYTNELLQRISSVDTNSLSIKEAFSFIDDIKEKALLILEGSSNNVK